VHIVAPMTELSKNETVTLQVKALLADGSSVDLGGHNLKWESDRPDIASVNGQDRLKAHNPGTATISTTIEVGGVTRTGTIRITVK